MCNDNERLEDLRQYQYAQIEIIHIFIRICEKEKLKYFMLDGTMLGAIRHKGYIPWDDDADFGMPRPDYEKFLLVAPSYISKEIELQTFNNTDDYCYYFCKIKNREKKVKVKWGKKEQIIKTGIDIFPIDGMPDNFIKRKLHSFHLLFRRMMFVLANFNKFVFINGKERPLYEKFLILIATYIPIEKCISANKQWKKLDSALKKYSYGDNGYLINMMGGYKIRETFPKEVFGSGSLYEFEDMLLNGPKDYDTYLSRLYGDYMTPPPLSERNKHETILITSSDCGE